MSGAPSRATITWLLDEILKAKREMDAGNKDRYISGRHVALCQAASRICQVPRNDLDKYMAWLEAQVEEGNRIGAVLEPAPWVRINCK
jgi:hypothetical protein